MQKTIHGTVHGKTIELDQELGLADGQVVEVQVRLICQEANPPASMPEGLARVYTVLGERYLSGHQDTASRHNEHQP